MGWRLALSLITLCKLAGAQVLQQEPIPTFTAVGTRYPNMEEDDQCRPIKLRLIRHSRRFTATLVRNTNSDLIYADEDARYMTSRLKFRLDLLAQWYIDTYNARLTVHLSYAAPTAVTDRPTSLHYEGRSVRISGTSNDHFPDILHQAVLSGFDWVIYANTSYCRVSVIPDVCQTNLDLLFLLDQSGSVGRRNHNLALQFIQAVVNFFEVGNNETRVAVFTFSTGARVNLLFDPNLTTQQVVSFIGAIPYRGGWTHTALALELAKIAFTYPEVNGARPLAAGVPRIVVLITDGRSNTYSITQPAIDLLATGATVYSIGIGNIYKPELNQIASDPDSDHVFVLNSYTDAASFVQLLSGTTCDTPANIPPGEEPENEIEEDDFKYFQVQCGTFSRQIIIEQIDITGHCAIYVSISIVNPGPLNSPLEVFRNETENVTRRHVIITVGIGQSVYISIRGITIINRFRMVVWNMLFSEDEYCEEVQNGGPADEVVIDLDILDANDDLYFFNITEGNSAGRFIIDSMTGVISTTQSLNAMQQSYYELTIIAYLRADDCQRGRTTVKVTVTTDNLHPPEIQTSPVSILETTPPNTNVVQLNASDPDFGVNGEIRYFITNGNNGSAFTINTITGLIKTATRLNHTQTPSYNLIIEARDQATTMPMTGTASQVINVQDVNQRPFFLTKCAIINTCTFLVSEDAALGDIGLHTYIEVGDPDSSMLQNGQVTLKLNPNTPFSINSTSGEITLISSLDRETRDIYNVNLTVSDNGNPPLSILTMITLKITDVNDNPPVIFALSTVSVPENTQVGVAIAQVASNDHDTGNNSMVDFSITGSSLFDIDSNTGTITVAESLDYETSTEHIINVTATNPDGLASSPHSILIMVTNINDNSPVFTMNPYSASVTEGSNISTVVVNVTANDADLDLAGEVRYSIVGGNVGDAFAINNDGIITVNSNIDREVINEYILNVRARDGVIPRRSDTSMVIITVNDINDNAPLFQRSQYSLTIREDVTVPSAQITLVVTDADEPGSVNSAIRYQIESGNVGMVFNISTTGVLIVQSSLNFESAASYSLVVTASDCGLVPLSSNATVFITVVNINDEIPVLSGDQNISISESAGVPTTIVTFRAMEEVGDILEFTLTGNHNGEFSINASTGVVTLVQLLDFEIIQQYTLTVTVSDGLFSDSLILTITVLDVNDNAPVFNIFGPFMVTEEQPANTLVGNVSVSDADSGKNAKILYSSTSGDDKFNISNDGQIRTVAELDREILGSALSFTVVATDNGVPQLSSVVTVSIQLIDINDNRPVFASPTTEVIISEGESTQTIIAMLEATDDDIGANAMISYQINESSLFTIDNSTGTIILTGSLDYETATEHSIDVTAINPDGLSSLPHPVLIRVANENDNLPVFTMNPYAASVEESSVTGTFVANVTAVDADLSAVSYSIENGNVGGAFSIDTISGIIIVNGSIDRETVSIFELTIGASDLGLSRKKRQSSLLMVTSTVMIEVSDLNDNPPQFQQSPYSIILREDAPLGTILSLIVTDADEPNTPNSMITYNITTGNEAGIFSLDNSGSLSLVQQLDFETQAVYLLTVIAQDQGEPPLTSNSTTVNITITNVNDLFPAISDNQVVNISELRVLGSEVAVFTASGEAGESLTFSLMGDSMGAFEIDTQSGSVTLARSLDYEQRTIYILQVFVSDGLFFNESTLTVNVLDENDNAPQIAPLDPLSVDEEMSVGTLVGMVTAFDADSGINAQLIFAISPAIIKNYISINSSTREIRTADVLDREELANNGRFLPSSSSSETFTINVTDGGFLMRSAEVVAILMLRDINDNPPIFTNLPNEVNVSENSAIGFDVLQVMATDADLGVNAQLQFSSMDNVSTFTIDSATGIVSLSSNLDYEDTRQHVVNITVTDGQHMRSNLLTINVSDENDNSPNFTQSTYDATIAENSPINTTVISVQASDTDSHVGEFGNLFYALLGEGNEFAISPGTGEITVNTMNLDRETVSLYTLTVVATDYGTPPRSSTAIVVVTVTDENDNAPMFQQLLYQSNIREDAQNQSVVITLLATDTDEPGNNNSVINYSLNDTNVFTIGSNSGIIQLASSLNFETISAYVLTVIARDRGRPSMNGTSTVIINVINVNDEPPRLSGNQSQSLNLSELTAVSTQVIRYIVVGESINESITYTLNGSQNDTFAINFTTGVVTLVQSLDYETIQFYSLNVFVNDNRFIVTSQLNITILDENDNAPQFDPVGMLQIDEEMPNGTFIGRVFASDGDSGENQVITYSFVQSSIGSLFAINATTGEIFTAITLDREMLVGNNKFLPPASQITFQVQAADGGTPSLFSQVDVTVQLVDVNDNAPVFVNPVSVIDVLESTSSGESIITITTTDADIGENARTLYSLSGSVLFYINVSTGEIFLNGTLDYESNRTHEIMITANNSDGSQSSSLLIQIRVIDVNDNSPVFLNDTYTATVMENSPVGTFVVRVTVTDADSGVSAEVHLSIVDGNEDNLFSIIALTGEIMVSDNIDREVVDMVNLTVSGTDLGNPPRSTNTTVLIYVLDTNDNTPLFNPSRYEMNISESVAISVVLLTVTVMDADETSPNNQITYSLMGSGSSPFRIEQNGSIILISALDFETQEIHSFIAVATDGGNFTFTSTAEVIINVINENDLPPVLTGDTMVSILESTRVGNRIARFTAIGEEGETLTFSLNVSNPFTIDNQTGVINVNEMLDFEITMFYNLQVTVSDGPFDSSAILLVELLDVNDNAPQIISAGPFVFEEEIPVNSSIGRILVDDADSGVNAQLSCTLAQAENKIFFFIDSNCSEVFTVTRIDRESIDTFNSHANITITVMLQVTDHGNPALSTERDVNFTIIEIDDNAPVFDNLIVSIDIEESTAVGEEVAEVSTTDADVGNDPIVYTLIGSSHMSSNATTSTNESSFFAINSSTGVITLISSLDYETAIVHTVTITAANPDGLQSADSAVYTFRVINENDNTPIFTMDPYNARVVEVSSNGTFVIMVSANDADLGVPGEVHYAVRTVGNLWNAFTINATSGVITVNGDIDREATSVFELTVVASDRGIPSRSSEALIIIDIDDINDNSPVFNPSSYTVTVLENVPVNYLLITVNATDADIPPNSVIMYNVTTSNNFFNISQNGSLFTTSLLDFETAPSHLVEVQAANNEVIPVLSSSAMITVQVLDVNDEQPFIIGITNVTVSEYVSIDSMISRFSVQNLEVGDVISFQLSGNMSEIFNINSSTGVVTLAQSLDFEITQSYDLLVTVDDGVFTNSIGLQVNVCDENDNSPIFVEFGPFVVIEELPINSTVGTVMASDADSGKNGNLSYTITSNVAGLFSINSRTGEISMTMILDRESLVNMSLFISPTFLQNITVQVEDNGSPSLISQAIISIRLLDINDNAPVFEFEAFEQNLTYPENIDNNTVIVEVVASDPDQGENGTVIYSINSDDELLPFAVDSSTGIVTTIEMLDRETIDIYTFEIVASDNGVNVVQSSIIEITVDITDINDNPPIFSNNASYTVDIPEDVTSDGRGPINALRVTATDEDIGVNAQITYLLAPDTRSEFQIQNKSGDFSISLSIIDFEGQNEFNVMVIATDGGLPALSSTAVVYIRIINIDEFAPIFNGPCDANVSEDALINVVITQCLATDQDSGVIFYQSFDIPNVFSLNFSTAEIILIRTLDREINDQYQFTVEAGSLFASETSINPIAEMLVTITVLDVNDNPPVFSPDRYEVVVNETTAVNPIVVTLNVTDNDINRNGQFSLRLTNTCSFNPPSGSNELYIINITAGDMGSPSLTGLATIALTTSCNPTECDLNNETRTISFSAFCEENWFVSTDEFYILGTPVQLNGSAFTNIPITYQWQLNGTFITNQSSNPILDLGEVDFDDVGSYSCIARTRLGNFQTDTASVIVYTLPTIERSPEHAAVEIGRTVQISCFASGVPNPEIKFYHDNVEVVLNNRVFQVGSFLVITDVTVSDQGTYYCQATNVVGTVRSSSASLIVFNIAAVVTVNLRINNPNENGTCHNLDVNMIENVLETSTNHNVDLQDEVVPLDGEFCVPNSCYPNPCQNNARCSVNQNATTGYVCDCPDTFTGVNCQDDLDECTSDDPCLFGNNCSNIPGLFECVCPPGREGHRCQYEIKCSNGSLCTGGDMCVETVANPLGYACISTPVEERLRIQLRDGVTINQVNEALYGLTNRLLELDPNSTDVCEPRFISVDGFDALTLVWGCPNGTDPLGIIAEDLICKDFLSSFLVIMCTLSNGTTQQPPEVDLEPVSVRVTFILTDPETNRTLPAVEAIMVLQQSNAQAALVSDNIQVSSDFVTADPTLSEDGENNDDSDNKSALDGGATAGIVIAVILVVVVIVILVIYVGHKYYFNSTKTSTSVTENKTLQSLQSDAEGGINQRTQTVSGMFDNRVFGRQEKKSVGAGMMLENPTFSDTPVITKFDGNTEPITKSAITRITSEKSKPSVTSETELLS